jgi:ribokinase
MADEPTILVVGSINMDLVVRTVRRPQPGETVFGEGFRMFPGGKGANQAVAAARLGGRVAMIGAVGGDPFGQAMLNNLRRENVETVAVRALDNPPTGVAMITVDSNGENSIIIDGGANLRVTADDDILPNDALFAMADVVLLQLELPMPTVLAAIELARRHGCKTILDPAPAPATLPEGLCNVSILSPNTSEAETITGKTTGGEERVDKAIASDLIALGAEAAVLKLGQRGCLAVMNDGHFYTVPAYKVNVVDTTAAGDCFNGALGVAIARRQRLHDACKFANAAGALACTRLGAQSAMPTAPEVRMLMDDQPI